MTAIVRISTYSGLITAPVAAGSGRFSSDSVGLLKQPPEGIETLTASTGAAVSSDSAKATRATRLILVQVQTGKVVHYAVTPQGQDEHVATTSHPTISGEVVIQFGDGWTISVLENSDV